MTATLSSFTRNLEAIDANVIASNERDRLAVIAKASGNLQQDKESNSKKSIRRRVNELSKIDDAEFINRLTYEVCSD